MYTPATEQYDPAAHNMQAEAPVTAITGIY